MALNFPIIQPPQNEGPINALVQGMQMGQERKRKQAETLLAQQRLSFEQKEAADRGDETKARLGLDQQRLATDTARMQAEERRANSQEIRQQRLEEHSQRKDNAESAAAILPYLDPSSPTFNPQAAHQLAGMRGLNLTQEDPGVQAPGPAPQAPAPVPEGPIQSPGDARATASQFAASRMSPQDGPVVPRAQQAGDQAAQQAMQEQAERDQYQQQLAEHPQRMAAHAEQIRQYQEAKQFPKFTLQTPSGSVGIDTRAMHQQAEMTRQARIEGYKQAFGGDDQALKIALPMAAMGIPDDKIAAAVNVDREKQTALAQKGSHDSEYSLTAKQKWDLGVMNANAHSMSARAGVAGKEDASAARAQGLLERAANDADKLVDWKGLSSMDNTTRQLLANVDSPNVLQSRDSQIQLARIFRGTTPTEGEMHLLYNNLGGTADKWDQFVAKLENGGLSDEQKRQVKASAATVQQEMGSRKDRAFNALQERFGPGSGYEVLGPQVNRILKAHGAAVGYEVPDLYDESGGQKGAQVLGSKGKNAPKANPLVNAAKGNERNRKLQAMPPEDKAAVDWADKHPEDPRAAKILQLHGI